jgi:uncharacterized protein involved in propanediol utilization
VVILPGRHLQRALVTLPSPLATASASFEADDSGEVKVFPGHFWKAKRAAELALKYLGEPAAGGTLRVTCDAPDRVGMGSSSISCAAAAKATGKAFGVVFAPTDIARIVVAAERAADSIMFPRGTAVVFAHRRGEVVEYLPGPLPTLEVLGVNTDPSGTGVDTLAFTPARYNSAEIAAFAVHVATLRYAARAQDAEAVGRVATASAQINQRFLAKPHFDRLCSLVKLTGALGLSVAHSGTVAGLLFAPGRSATTAMSIAEAELARLGLSQTWRFTTDSEVQDA